MGFLSQLAKGFIRSGVNQIGRDAGKVVSNKIYGDAHSIPYRSVSGRGGAAGDSGSEISDVVRKATKLGCWGWLAYIVVAIGFAHFFAGHLYVGRYWFAPLFPLTFIIIGYFKGQRDYVFEYRNNRQCRKVPAEPIDRKMIKAYARTFYLIAIGIIILGLFFLFDGKPEDFADIKK